MAMKISKDDLFYIFDCADDPDQHVQWGLDMNDIKNALIEDDLEIEGYERVQWTRFDPNDPKTFPMRNENVLLYVELDDGGRQMMNARTFIMNKCHFLDLKGKLISEEKMDAITHWRPLPPPPGKEGK